MADSQASSLGEGVYFPRAAYAGLGRRFVIMAIDALVIIVVWVMVSIVWTMTRPDLDFTYPALAWVGFLYAYLAIVEATPLGTVGFMVTGVKILNLKGERPSILRMTLRLVLWVLGPINPIVDLIWLGGDEFRQTLRDKFAGTVVVKRGVEPAGRGPIHVRYYAVLGLWLAVAEVQKSRAP